MTAGVVIILGPAEINLASGMTGGLAYILKEFLREGSYSREFVHCMNPDGLEPAEEARLRLVLEEHVRRTASPRAMRILEIKGPLPFVRLEPIHLPCSLAQTWSPILARLESKPPTKTRTHHLRWDWLEPTHESLQGADREAGLGD